jgi:hypothetical protein
MTAYSYKLASTPIPAVNSEKWCDVSEQARAASFPLVVRDLLSPKSRHWSPQRLTAESSGQPVAVNVNLPSHGVPYREQISDHHRKMRLDEFVALLQSGQSCYLNQVPLKDFPALESELNLKELRLGRIFSANLWVGCKTRSGLHFDNADNLFGQIYGQKRALLVSPNYSKFLYPFSDNPSKSQVDLECPDLERHPKCVRVQVWSCELGPGDALYIPRGWWHYISTEDISISINCWHGDTLSGVERVQMFLAGGLRVVWRASYDFFWHGVFGRPYPARLFSPPSPGIQAYNKVRAQFK